MRLERIGELLPVEPVRDRLADEQLVHRRLRLVDRHVADVEAGALDQPQRRILLDGGGGLRGDEVVAVDVTGLERVQPVGLARDDAEDDPGERRPVTPVLVVPDEHELTAVRPGVEPERAGPDGRRRAERSGALDRERGQRQGAEEGAVRPGQPKLHGLPAGNAPAVQARLAGEPAEDALPVVAAVEIPALAGEAVPAVEVRADGGAGQRGAVLEVDVGAETERPDLAARARRPRDGERGPEVGRAGLERHQPVEDLRDHASRLDVGGERAVERGRLGGDPERQRLPARASPAEAAGGDERKRQQQNGARNRFTRPPSASRDPVLSRRPAHRRAVDSA